MQIASRQYPSSPSIVWLSNYSILFNTDLIPKTSINRFIQLENS